MEYGLCNPEHQLALRIRQLRNWRRTKKTTNHTTMLPEVESYLHFEKVLSDKPKLLIYYSHDACAVCKVLKPKVKALMDNSFPGIGMYYADTRKNPQIAGQQQVFAVPTLIFYYNGREQFRKSRSFSLDELEILLDKYEENRNLY